MTRVAAVLVVLLGACAGEESVGTNPPTLWLAMSSGSQMRLVDVEPHPY
jgi:hypothetical protein